MPDARWNDPREYDDRDPDARWSRLRWFANRTIRVSYGNLNETDSAAMVGTLPMPSMTTGSNCH